MVVSKIYLIKSALYEIGQICHPLQLSETWKLILILSFSKKNLEVRVCGVCRTQQEKYDFEKRASLCARSLALIRCEIFIYHRSNSKTLSPHEREDGKSWPTFVQGSNQSPVSTRHQLGQSALQTRPLIYPLEIVAKSFLQQSTRESKLLLISKHAVKQIVQLFPCTVYHDFWD